MTTVSTDSTGRPYGGRSAAERTAKRRSAFLSAGLELYGTRPAEEVTVSDLLAQAGQTRRAFYELFADGADLLRQVDEDLINRPISARLAACPTPLTQTSAERALADVLRLFREDPRRIRVAARAVPGPERLDRIGAALGRRAGPDAAARRRAVQAYAGAAVALLSSWAWAEDEPFGPVADELLALLRARFFGA